MIPAPVCCLRYIYCRLSFGPKSSNRIRFGDQPFLDCSGKVWNHRIYVNSVNSLHQRQDRTEL